MPRCVVHCPPERGGSGFLAVLGAVAAMALVLAAVQAVLSVAAALFWVVMVACAASVAVLVRLLVPRRVREYSPPRPVRIPAALAAPRAMIEGPKEEPWKATASATAPARAAR